MITQLKILFFCSLDPVRVLRAVLLEIATDDTLSTGTEGTKLCLSYTKVLLKQLTEPTTQDKEFAGSLIECLNGTIKD